MGKPINKNTKNLDDLLEHLNTPSNELDAFEQEALEGFALLENKQEIVALKNRLDERMEKEVLVKKRKPLFIYWSAAAGIALLIGLIFIFNNTNSLEKQDLAQNSIVQQEIKNLENAPPSPPAELTKTTKSEKKRQDDLRNNREDIPGNPVTRSNEQLAGDGKSDEAIAGLAQNDNKNQNFKEEAGKDDKSGEVATAKPLADNANERDQRNEPQALSNNAAGAAASETKSKLKESQDEDKESHSNTADAVFARRIEKEKGGNKDAKKASASPQKVKSEIEGPFEKSNIKTATLTIKEGDLTKLITKFLADKDYKKSFKCTLTINSSNKVEEIVFDNTDLFKKSDANDILNFFKKQKCFKNNEYAVYSTYKVNYVSE